MSHFVETMAYAGEIPWHRLGTYAGERNLSALEMMKLAQLDWTVEKTPVKCNGFEIDGVFGMIRSSDGKPLDGVSVGSKYTALQNAQLAEFIESLRSAAGDELRVHTAGSLMGGRKVWFLAQLAGEINVERRGGRMDTSAPFLLVHNSHDGKSHALIQHTSVRVVCWNTLSAAIGKTAGQHKIRHTASAETRLTEAAKNLGYAFEYFSKYAELAQNLADTPMSRAEFVQLLAVPLVTKIDDPAAAKDHADKILAEDGRSATMLQNKIEDLLRYFERGKGNGGADRFDALNAVTEYVDSQRGRIATYKANEARLFESRFASGQFGEDADLKGKAVALLTR